MSTENEKVEIISAKPAISFEVAILEEKEPVKLTADLIREKAKPFTSIVINDILDEKNYKLAKSNRMKVVKIRTAITNKQGEIIKAIKARHTGELSEVNDYVAELITACQEEEKVISDKITAIDDERSKAAKKLEDERKEKTELREAKMYDLGMAWNGQNFTGYGKLINKDYLFNLSKEMYENLVEEITGLQITGEPISAVEATPVRPEQSGSSGGFSWPSATVNKPTAAAQVDDKPPFENIIFQRSVAGAGIRIFITKGEVPIDNDALVINADVNNSGYFLHVIR